MATKTLPQVPPVRKTQQQPAVPTPLPKQIDELKKQFLWDFLKAKRLCEKQESGHVPDLQPLEKGTTLTLAPEETQAVAEYLDWVEGLSNAAQNAVSILRLAMEIGAETDENDQRYKATAKHGHPWLWESYSPLSGVGESLELLAHRLIEMTNRVESAEWKLPDRLRETKKAAAELYASDSGN